MAKTHQPELDDMEGELEVPAQFDFPFPPYDIQHQFMSELYKVLEKKQLGIFESPTGTGKSLSILCGALRWLKDHNQKDRLSIENSIKQLQVEMERLANDSSDWMSSQSKEIEIKHKVNKLKIDKNKIEEYDRKIEKIINRTKTKREKSKIFKKAIDKEDEQAIESKINNENEEDDVIEDVSPVDEKLSDEENDEDDKYRPVKVFICSRTHSQLAQFVGEIRKSPYGNETRTVSLGSRQNYCINPLVTKLKNVNLINERCLDMQKNKSKATKKDEDGKATKKKRGENCKCAYYNQTKIEELRDEILTEINDIEDLVSAGKKLNACPYYASRKAIEDTEVVLVPYNTILHKATRVANGIEIKNNVVIIDEAHNLLEAFAQMYSSTLKYEQVKVAQEQLKNYKMKYSTRFSAFNLLCINQILFVLNKLKLLMEDEASTGDTTKIFSLNAFVTQAEIDNFNMFKLVRFIKHSKISQKLHSFCIKHPNESEVNTNKGVKGFLESIENKRKNEKIETANPSTSLINKPANMSNPMLAVLQFMESLTYSQEDGRIIFYKEKDLNSRKLHFLLLNPASQFTEIVKEARAVIVAGGTMKPNAEFSDRLFKAAGADPNRIVEFSCDHIIPPENILPVIMTKGSKNEKLLFNYENRFSMAENIKTVIEKACQTVLGGIVIFFPSYKYENWVWQQIKDINFGRNVFREPQDSSSVDAVLEEYANCIQKTKKALLLSVVGGKLSEGLNFSDSLGRCIIVLGMPYANIMAPELKEKMAYIDKVEGKGSGQKFYENLCFKAVNQCIGRSVRHKNDYATVILLDERYNRTSSKNALPEWIKRSLKVCYFDETFRLFQEFFQEKNKNV